VTTWFSCDGPRSARDPYPGAVKSLAAGLTGLVLSVALVLVAFPASSTAAVASKRASLTSTYTCSSPAGTSSSKVVLDTAFPKSVRAGSTVAARRVTASITVPKKFVDFMRQYGVESISGKAVDAKFRVGKKRVGVSDVVLPQTAVPASGGMTLRGVGTAGAFSIGKPGTYAVRIPTAFDAKIMARTRSFGDVAATLSCTLAKGAPDKLGALTVR